MFDFHNIFFCCIYVIVSFCFSLGLYFKFVFRIVDENKIMGRTACIATVYVVGIGISLYFTFYLFRFVQFIQLYY